MEDSAFIFSDIGSILVCPFQVIAEHHVQGLVGILEIRGVDFIVVFTILLALEGYVIQHFTMILAAFIVEMTLAKQYCAVSGVHNELLYVNGIIVT